jgi:hypothetical protein
MYGAWTKQKAGNRTGQKNEVDRKYKNKQQKDLQK